MSMRDSAVGFALDYVPNDESSRLVMEVPTPGEPEHCLAVVQDSMFLRHLRL